ncbi:MAG: 5-bromo-4-chloroindolyl phosphate hydrolysis family protein [Planctomycetota bacterium]|nr:5-bromo-4-chloroindolyl phosphate hydrolysis family protein [Planctomycetota bacterium]
MRREIVGGIVGLGLFAGAAAASLPIGIAAAAGALGYFGGWFLMPRKRESNEILLDEGVNKAQLDEYVGRLSKSVDDLAALAAQISDGGMRGRVEALRGITTRIIGTVRKDPRDIRNEPGLPMWAEKIVERIAAYVELAHMTGDTARGTEKLNDCKLMVERAVAAFEQIHRDMLDDDMNELSAGSKALRDILESKIRKDQEGSA